MATFKSWGAREMRSTTLEQLVTYLEELAARRSGPKQVAKLCVWLFKTWRTEQARAQKLLVKQYEKTKRLEAHIVCLEVDLDYWERAPSPDEALVHQADLAYHNLDLIILERTALTQKLRDADAVASKLRAENQLLQQHLATHLVPVPGNPGMSFIAYPN